MSLGTPWTETDIQQLMQERENSKTCQEISLKLDRSMCAIYTKVYELGISKQSDWTEEDKQTIILLYGIVDKKDIAKMLNKTPLLVRKMAQRLGVTEPIHWSPEEDAILIDLIEKNTTNLEISKILDRSRRSITYRCAYNNNIAPHVENRKQIRAKHKQEIDNIIIQLHKDGKNTREIATELGVAASNISKIGKRLNLIFDGNSPTYVHGEIRKNHYKNIAYSARHRSLDFQITPQYVWRLFLAQDRKCALSGVELVMDSMKTNDKRRTASLDRIDSSVGYIEGNVQWVHKSVNLQKGSMSDKDLINWCHLISQHNLPANLPFLKV